MIVLGIDCGTERTGYGVIESDGRSHRLIDAGTIRVPAAHALEKRLLAIAAELRRVIQEFGPGAAAVEEVFHHANARSAIRLAHARGIALLAIAEAGLEAGEYSPLTVKNSVVGYGRAEKSQVRLMVHRLLGLQEEIRSEDTCDAIAVAICHACHLATAATVDRSLQRAFK